MRILFVCTRNTFRSFSAELCLKDYLDKNKMHGHDATSAAISPFLSFVHPVTRSTLKANGIRFGWHRPKRLTKGLIANCDLVIAMAEYHKRKVKEKFGADAILFNEIAYGERTSVLDVDDARRDWFLHPAWTDEFIKSTVQHIHDGMPQLVKNLGKYGKGLRP